jgi:glycosyltransferase involved in cell wall biosynthesis
MHQIFNLESWKWRLCRPVRPWIRRNWPVSKTPNNISSPKIAVVTVSYNTKELLARLVYSLHRIVDDAFRIGPIVVVDNNSTDGSVQLIECLAAAGLVEPLYNHRQKYHGPGLNQGIDHLALKSRRKKPGFEDIDYVFVVDSDVFVSRGELFSHALDAMRTAKSAMAGEIVANAYLPGGDAHVSSLLFDPAVFWRRGFHPFEQHGAPALEFQRTVVKRRYTRLDFPFRTNFYVVHLWNGTLKAICSSNDRQNKYFDWAAAELPKRTPMDEKTEYIVAEFEERFRAEVPAFDPAQIVAACQRESRVRLKRPYELAPQLKFTPTGQLLGEGLVAR